MQAKESNSHSHLTFYYITCRSVPPALSALNRFRQAASAELVRRAQQARAVMLSNVCKNKFRSGRGRRGRRRRRCNKGTLRQNERNDPGSSLLLIPRWRHSRVLPSFAASQTCIGDVFENARRGPLSSFSFQDSPGASLIGIHQSSISISRRRRRRPHLFTTDTSTLPLGILSWRHLLYRRSEHFSPSAIFHR